uniref:Uncharacterized protein LOC104218887 n=1 Tax=Nicotiana sylvestris TaxID=4096 RepID=A0A1U7VZH1_NICSY|nr:PREDICTED: uncharacterized protein LOC104218887 [Nicotiana sylvestris]
MKLNTEKSAFWISSDKFLGFLLLQRGIEVNPNKIKAIEDIPGKLSSVKEVQRLIGRLAALSRFISRSSEKCHHFIGLLKKKNYFEWTRNPGTITFGYQRSSDGFRIDIRSLDLVHGQSFLQYKALIEGLKLARGLDSKVIEIKCDSQLVVNQVYGIFKAKEERMQQYVMKVPTLLARFQEWSIKYIPREENAEANALDNLGSSTEIKASDSGMVVQLMHSVLDANIYYEVNATNLV